KLAAAQIMRGIRGRQSQRTLARRLGYMANPVRDWEAGRRFPTAAEALRAAEVCGVDVIQAFARFRQKSSGRLTSVDEQCVADWLDESRGATTVTTLARRTGHSRYSIGRWL